MRLYSNLEHLKSAPPGGKTPGCQETIQAGVFGITVSRVFFEKKTMKLKTWVLGLIIMFALQPSAVGGLSNPTGRVCMRIRGTLFGGCNAVIWRSTHLCSE